MSGVKVYRFDEEGTVIHSVRDKILEAEKFIASLPQVEIEPKHVFADGIYSREILIPAGTVITGKVHRNSDLNIVVYGHMRVRTEDGIKDVHAPAHFRGCAGVKQIGYAYDDTLWITVHATRTTNLDELEKELFIECEDEPHVLDFKTGKALQKELK